MKRGGGTKISAALSPVVIGAMTVLTALIAVFLSYNANSGLPFVTTYDIQVQVPNADALVRGNEVRVGGARVGRIDAITPDTLPDGREVATISMSLDRAVEPLPADSTVLIRPRSALALKYLEITPGKSDEVIAAGGTLGVEAAKVEPVDLDELFNTFDGKTRAGIKGNLEGFGNALAGRGEDLNLAFGELRNLVRSAEPAARQLARRKTNLDGFFKALAATASEVAPVASEQADLFANLNRTFAAFSQIASPYLDETIARSPAVLEEADRSLPVIRPFLAHSAEFFTALQPGADALRESSPEIASALVTGSKVLPRSPALNKQLAPTAQAFVDFGEAPGVESGLNRLMETNDQAGPALRFIAPAQTVCNYLSILFENVARTGKYGDGLGHWQHFFPITPPYGPNAESSPASAPASGGEVETPTELPQNLDRNYLHINPYPNTASPGQTRECEAGREIYERRTTMIGNVPGNQGTKTRGQKNGGKG